MTLEEQVAERLWRAGQESPFAHGDEMSLTDASFMSRVAGECIRLMEWARSHNALPTGHAVVATAYQHVNTPLGPLTLPPDDWMP